MQKAVEFGYKTLIPGIPFKIESTWEKWGKILELNNISIVPPSGIQLGKCDLVEQMRTIMDMIMSTSRDGHRMSAVGIIIPHIESTFANCKTNVQNSTTHIIDSKSWIYEFHSIQMTQ